MKNEEVGMRPLQSTSLSYSNIADLIEEEISNAEFFNNALRRNLSGNDIEIIQLEEEVAQELTLEAVQEEVNRIGTAVKAMGATLEIVHVDPAGEVKIQFNGPDKVKQGLELALLDIPYCKVVTFI